MVEGFSKTTYKGKEIYFTDYSQFAKDKTTQKEKTIRLRREVTAEYLGKPLNSVLTLLNVTDFFFDMDVLKAFKEEYIPKQQPIEKKSAVVGVKGLVKAAYNFVVGFSSGSKVKLFNTIEEAKEWLISD